VKVRGDVPERGGGGWPLGELLFLREEGGSVLVRKIKARQDSIIAALGQFDKEGEASEIMKRLGTSKKGHGTCLKEGEGLWQISAPSAASLGASVGQFNK